MYLPITWEAAVSLIIIILTTSGCAGIPPAAGVDQTGITETEIYHYVDPGETIYDIAQRYGRTAEEIAQWNHLTPPYRLEVHQKLLVSGPPEGQPIAFNNSIVRRPIGSSKRPKKTTPAKTCSGKTYQVQRSDTLYSVAKRCGRQYREIATWNNLSPPYSLKVGQKLLVSSPPRSASSASPVVPALQQETYTVQPKDTLYSIAKRSGHQVAEIMQWNHLSSSDLPLGKTLLLAAPSKEASTPRASKKPKSSKKYMVQPGDTLYSIAKQTGTNTRDMMAWNNLSSPHLSLGQQLLISPPPNSKCHQVTAQETLFSIAKSYHLPVATLAKWNNLSPPYHLKIGQNLQVSSQTCR